jgi:hypothetical protein
MLFICTFALFLGLANLALSETACNTPNQDIADAQPPIRNITVQNVTRRAAALSLGTPQKIGFEVAP